VVSWAITAAYDYTLEKQVRWIPKSIREFATALYVIAKAPTYSGEVSFLPVPLTPEQMAKGMYNDYNALPNSKEDEGWKVIGENFVLFCSTNAVDGSQTIVLSPGAKLCEGAIDLLIIRTGVSRLQMLNAFLKMGNGTHLTLPYFECYKAKEYKLKPKSQKDHMDASGETIDCSETHVIAHKGCAKFISTRTTS